jgi:uncharacterized membrane protein YgcG
MRLKLINACFVSQSSLEPLLVLILLASTDLKCGFVPFYQTVLQSAQIGSQIIWQFVSAALTDRTETWAQWFLLCTLLVQTGCDIAMYFFSYNKWALLALFICRFAFVQQIGNSVGKIFKMRIQLVMELPPEEQMSAFNILSITGDFIGRLVSVCGVYVVALALNKWGDLSYNELRNMFFIGLIGWDAIAVICTVTIRTRYYLPEPSQVDARIESRLEVARKSASVSEKASDSLLTNGKLIDDIGSDDQSSSSAGGGGAFGSFGAGGGLLSGSGGDAESDSYDADTPLLSGIIDDPGPTPTLSGDNFTAWQYLIFCIKSFVYNRLLLLSMIHLWMVTTLLAFVTIVLRFDVTSQGTDETNPEPSNFCGNLLINLIETQLAGEVCRLIGAVLYQGYMCQISPLHFYKVVYLVYAAINAVMLFAVIFPLGPSLGSVVLGVITVFIYLSMIYSANISSVVMDSSMAGFVFGVQGSGVQLLALIPVATVAIASKFSIPTPFITGYCVMHSVWSACFALYFALTSRKGLEALNDGKPSKNKCKRCLLGY